MVVKCHEFFDCQEKECKIFDEDEKRNCWDIEPTATTCTNRLPRSVTKENKIFHCHNCPYYRHFHRK